MPDPDPETNESKTADTWHELVLENALDAVIGINAAQIVIAWNKQAHAIFGWTKAEAIGRKLSELIIPPELRERHVRGLARFLQTGTGPILNRRIELEGLRRNGRRFPVELTVVPVRVQGSFHFYSFVRDLSETRRQEAEVERAKLALRASELQLKLVIDALPALVAYLDHTGIYRFANVAYEQWFGIAPGGLVGKRLRDVLPAVALERALPGARQALAGERVRYENQLPGPGGLLRWVDVEYIPDIANDGTVPGYVVVAYDITERRQAEETLKMSEVRFRTLFEQSPYSTQLLSVDGRTVQVNRAWQELWGISQAVIQNYILTEYNVLEDPQLAAKGLLPYLRRGFAGEPTRIPAALYDPVETTNDGRPRWVRGFIYPIRDLKGAVTQVVLIHEDVTNDIEAKATIRESDERFRVFVEGVQDYAISVLDPSGMVVSWNSGAERIHGYTADEIIGKDFSAFYEEQALKDGLPARHLREASTDGRFAEEGWRVRKDGSRFWASVVLTARMEDGKVGGFSQITRDISAQKKADEEKQQLINEMQRTQFRLEEAIHARDEFISICSHELKTPITSLKLQFQVAERQMKRGDPDAFNPDRTAKRVNLVNRQMDRMSKLIDDMLDVSRVATGRLELNPERLDLNELVLEVAQRFVDQLRESGITLVEALSPTAIWIEADRVRLEQVVTNLITNAMKYGDGKPIRVSTTHLDGLARLAVQDSGIGIAPESLTRIFERYERAVPSQNISGLGLGLYISRQIVLAHRGTIRAESEVGHGSTFIVELPAETEQAG